MISFNISLLIHSCDLDQAVLMDNFTETGTDGTQCEYIVVYCSPVKANHEYVAVYIITLKLMFMFRGSAFDLCKQ